MLRRREWIIKAAAVERWWRCKRVALSTCIAGVERRRLSWLHVLQRLRPRRRRMLRRLREGVAAAEGVCGRGLREGVCEGVRRRHHSTPNRGGFKARAVIERRRRGLERGCSPAAAERVLPAARMRRCGVEGAPGWRFGKLRHATRGARLRRRLVRRCERVLIARRRKCIKAGAAVGPARGQRGEGVASKGVRPTPSKAAAAGGSAA